MMVFLILDISELNFFIIVFQVELDARYVYTISDITLHALSDHCPNLQK